MKNKKIFYGWWIVLGCVVITCTMVPLIMSLANKFLIQVTEEMQVSRSAFTLTNTILQALGIFLSPFVAKKLAGGNMRKIQSFSILGFALAYGSFSMAQSVWHFYISGFFVGVFYLNATLIPVSMMITNWFVKKRGLAMSISMAGIGLGGFLFSPVVTYLLDNFGWRMTYRFMALGVLVLALPVSLFVLRKKPEDMGLKAYGAEEEASMPNKKTSASYGISLSVPQSKTKMFFWILLIGMFANSIVNAGALGQFPPALEEMHGSGVQAAIISMYSLTGIFGKLLLGWINDRFGIIASTTFGCTAFVLAFSFMLLGENTAMLYIMAFFFGMGTAIGTVTPPLITAAIYGTKKYGEAYGVVNSASQIGLSVGSLFVAYIYDFAGSYRPAWLILLLLTVIAYVGWIGAYVSSRKYSEKIVAV